MIALKPAGAGIALTGTGFYTSLHTPGVGRSLLLSLCPTLSPSALPSEPVRVGLRTPVTDKLLRLVFCA